MKKQLLTALLAIALLSGLVACTDKDNPAETQGDSLVESVEATTPDTDDTSPEETDAETPVVTEAPDTTPPETDPPVPPDTLPPETDPPKPPETDPPTPPDTEPPEPEDPNAPIGIFDADDLNIMDGVSHVTAMERAEDYLTIIPTNSDPHYYPIRNEDGGRYIAVKYRAFNAEGMSIQIYPGSSGSSPSNDDNSLRISAIDDEQWHLAIFDTASIDSALYDGSYISYLRFDPLDGDYILDESGQPYKENGAYVRNPLPEGARIDIRYIGVFKTEEAARIYDAQPQYIMSASDISDAVAVDGAGVKAEENAEGFTTISVTAADPQVMLIPAGTVPELSGKYIAIRYRTTATAPMAEFFVGSGAGPVAGTTEKTFNYINDGDWHLMVVDISGVQDMTGDINFLRFDVFNSDSTELSIDIQYIAVFQSPEDAVAYDQIINPTPENSTSFDSDINKQTAGTTLDASDLAGGFLAELPLGENIVKDVDGKLFYQLSGICDLLATTDGTYYFKVNLLSADASSAVVVRGNGMTVSDESIEKFNPDGGIYKINNFYETDGSGAFGGSGVYARLDGGVLNIRVKVYMDGVVTRVKNVDYSIEAPGTELCIVDDGSSLHFLVDGKKYAEIALMGKTTYADIQASNCSVSNVFAKTAVIKFADGNEYTLEDTLVVASYNANIALATRGGKICFTSVAYGGASLVTVPPMEQTITRVNVAQGKPVTADSVENETNIPENATDGDPTTRWGAFPTGPANLTVDLLYTYTIDQIYVYYENSVLPHTVSISVDGVEFTTVYESPSRGAGEQLIRFAATDARYIRFTREGDAPEGSNWFSIYELQALVPISADEEPVLWNEKKDIVLHQSFDELRVNGSTGASLFTPGQSEAWDGKAVPEAGVTSLYYHGWIAVKGETGKLGYQIDDADPVFNDAFLLTAEQGVLDAAAPLNPDATYRMGIDVDLKNIFGTHTIKVLYQNVLGQTVILCEFTAEIPARVKPEHNYVSDGLVSMYNQHNLGTGYDIWWDNVGDNDMKVNLNDNCYLADDGFHTQSVKHNLPDAIVDVVNGQSFTVEILFGDFVCMGPSYCTFLNSSNDNFALFRRTSSDELEFKFASNPGDQRHKIPGAEALLPNSLITITYTVGGECTIYINGQAAQTKTSPSSMGANDLYIGHDDPAKDFQAVFQSLRFYDRALTAAEVLANAQADGKA